MKTVTDQLKDKTWDGCRIYIPGLQPIAIQPSEIEDIADDFIKLKDEELDNEQGKATVGSYIRISSIATVDFITKSKIINPLAKGKIIH